jgi:hypothetical protein
MSEFKVDVKLAEKFRRLCVESRKIEGKILDVIDEFCKQNGIKLDFIESNLDPFYYAQGTEYLLVYPAYKPTPDGIIDGYVVVDEKGRVSWTEKIEYRS